jgi:hypothetical protein
MRNSKTTLQAWQDFQSAAQREEPNGIVTLSLIRDARVFTTAPKDETESWEVLIGAASKQGMRKGLIAFGEELRDWSKKNGYRLALLTSGGAAALLAAM